jgi:hypothetical protein
MGRTTELQISFQFPLSKIPTFQHSNVPDLAENLPGFWILTTFPEPVGGLTPYPMLYAFPNPKSAILNTLSS